MAEQRGLKPTYHVDSTPLSKEETEYINQLYDDDFGAINERVLDYNHPKYIEDGLNVVNWGNDSADIPHSETLLPGDVISRYGSESGQYFGDIGTDFNSRQLPYSEDKVLPKYYEVIKPLPVKQSTIAEQKNWSDATPTRNAQQYRTEKSEAWLRDNGYIKEISKERAEEMCPSGKTSISDRRMARSFKDDLNNADLFDENEQGKYTYEETEYGKSASGSLKLETGERDLAAQRSVGGNDRRSTDDGGHLIGTRFSGDSSQKNMEAQDRNLNRGSYKIMENDWANSLENGDKVFVDVESYRSNDSERPDAFVGYSITEHSDGTRDWDAFSYQNESAATQDEWNKTVDENDFENRNDNPINYNPADYEDELSDNDYFSGGKSVPKNGEDFGEGAQKEGGQGGPENDNEPRNEEGAEPQDMTENGDNKNEGLPEEQDNSLPNEEGQKTPTEEPSEAEDPKNGEDFGEGAQEEGGQGGPENDNEPRNEEGTEPQDMTENGDNKNEGLPEEQDNSLPNEEGQKTPTEEPSEAEDPKSGEDFGEGAQEEGGQGGPENDNEPRNEEGAEPQDMTENGDNKNEGLPEEQDNSLPNEEGQKTPTEEPSEAEDPKSGEDFGEGAQEEGGQGGPENDNEPRNEEGAEPRDMTENGDNKNEGLPEEQDNSLPNEEGQKTPTEEPNESEEPENADSRPQKEEEPEEAEKNEPSESGQSDSGNTQAPDYGDYYGYGY